MTFLRIIFLKISTSHVQGVGLKLSKNSEIDFGVKIGDKLIPVECKASKKFKPQNASPVIGYCDLFHLKCGIVLNLDIPHEIEKGDIHVHSLPAYLSDEILRLVTLPGSDVS